MSSEFGVRFGIHQGFIYSERTANEKQKELSVLTLNNLLGNQNVQSAGG